MYNKILKSILCIQIYVYRAGVYKLRSAGRMWPARPFHAAHMYLQKRICITYCFNEISHMTTKVVMFIDSSDKYDIHIKYNNTI